MNNTVNSRCIKLKIKLTHITLALYFNRPYMPTCKNVKTVDLFFLIFHQNTQKPSCYGIIISNGFILLQLLIKMIVLNSAYSPPRPLYVILDPPTSTVNRKLSWHLSRCYPTNTLLKKLSLCMYCYWNCTLSIAYVHYKDFIWKTDIRHSLYKSFIPYLQRTAVVG